MNMVKNVACMAMGATFMAAYQKYKEPVKSAAMKAFKETKKKANEALEDMM